MDFPVEIVALFCSAFGIVVWSKQKETEKRIEVIENKMVSKFDLLNSNLNDLSIAIKELQVLYNVKSSD